MKFVEYLEDNLSSQTVTTYNYAVNSFLDKNPEADKYNYAEFVNSLFNSMGSKRTQLPALKHYYSYLISEGIRKNHPCLHLTLKQKNKHIQFQDLFSLDELELLIDRESRYKDLYNRNRFIIGLLIYQGLKPNNIVNLRIEHINFEDGCIKVVGSRTLNGRRLRLSACQLNDLVDYMNTKLYQTNKHRNKTLIFNKLGDKLTVDCLTKLIKPLKHLFPDRNLNCRTIRQSVISNWLNVQNKGLEATFEFSGHKWLSSTEKYRRENIKEKKRLIDRFHPL